MIENNYQDIKEAQDGNQEKMEYLIKNNYGLVYSIAKRFVDRGYEIEDLTQIGVIGLIKAIKNFKTEFQVKLSTYSVPYILGEIKRFVRDDGRIKVSRSLKELAAKVEYLQKEYQARGEELPSIEKIAGLLKVSKEEITIALDATSYYVVTSIDEPIKRR